MKRPNADNYRGGHGGGDYKRSRSDGYSDALAEGKFELRLLIPSRMAGAVIGKGGEYIKAIRDKVSRIFGVLRKILELVFSF